MRTLIAFLLMATNIQASEVLFAGDVTLTKHISNQANFLSQKATSLINSSALFLYNVEFSGPGQEKKNRFIFTCDLDIIDSFNFTNSVGLVANNHSFDGCEEGFLNLLKSMEKFDMKYIGTPKPLKYNNFYLLGYSPMICNPMLISFENLISKIKEIKRWPSEYIIVSIHDGIENSYAPSPRQKEQAKILSDLGVDIICYTHSHTYMERQKSEIL